MLRTYHTVRIVRLPIRYRMCSTSPTYPTQIFSKAVPHPQPWPTPIPPLSSGSWSSSSSREWKEAENNEKTIRRALSNFQRALRFAHKRKVDWPTAECDSSKLRPSEYLTTLLSPIANIFNQLHSPDVLKTPMEYIPLAFGESIYGATFKADEFEFRKLIPPIFLCLPGELFDSKGNVSSRVEYALFKAFEYSPSTPSIVVSNFEDIAIFSLSGRSPPKPVFERVSTTQPSLALRVLAAAYLHRHIDRGGEYINLPPATIEVDESVVLPQGPPQDSNQPLLADEQIFKTHQRHSDFDFETLVRNRARALQFFRWHAHVRQQNSKVVARPHDTLVALTNEVGREVPDTGPIFPYDASELPPDTTKHLELIHRASPLETAGIADLFERSKSFTLKIQDVIAEGTEHGICTVYRCQITSIDNYPVTSPSLCLKLFDDRFQLLNIPNEEDERDDLIARWFDVVAIAEDCAINEAFAYNKLRPAQGTVIPWFYGNHQFTLPDGTVLYGLLMEYTDGCTLGSEELSVERQINMIQSCHHATRVLDVADVSQCDWHSGQIIMYTNPITKIDHAILIDFASTTQTWHRDGPHRLSNYREVFFILVNCDAFDVELVWKHFGDPDDWDPIVFRTVRHKGGNDWITLQAREMFPYISDL
ncbi:hypothetical protein BJ912DRAFT_1006667 [Pholiota molesta]|nr:hypothetical protein BJ912DRAFT_1006667 [Pholiota molesta]